MVAEQPMSSLGHAGACSGAVPSLGALPRLSSASLRNSLSFLCARCYSGFLLSTTYTLSRDRGPDRRAAKSTSCFRYIAFVCVICAVAKCRLI